MTNADAAARIGVPEHMVVAVNDHPGGVVVTLRAGADLLVSDTVVRPYVPEVDGPLYGDVEPEPERTTEPDTTAADAKPAPRGTRKAAR